MPHHFSKDLLIPCRGASSGATFAARKVPMPKRTKNTVLIRLLASLLLLGTQHWLAGLHAAHLPTPLFELGALPSEVEDQHEGPDHDPGFGISALQGWSLRCAFWRIAAPKPYESDHDRCGISLLPVAGLQPSAP